MLRFHCMPSLWGLEWSEAIWRAAVEMVGRCSSALFEKKPVKVTFDMIDHWCNDSEFRMLRLMSKTCLTWLRLMSKTCITLFRSPRIHSEFFYWKKRTKPDFGWNIGGIFSEKLVLETFFWNNCYRKFFEFDIVVTFCKKEKDVRLFEEGRIGTPYQCNFSRCW